MKLETLSMKIWKLEMAGAVVRRSSVKGVFKKFAKFTEKHLCQSLFLNKVEGLRAATLTLLKTPEN